MPAPASNTIPLTVGAPWRLQRCWQPRMSQQQPHSPQPLPATSTPDVPTAAAAGLQTPPTAAVGPTYSGRPVVPMPPTAAARQEAAAAPAAAAAAPAAAAVPAAAAAPAGAALPAGAGRKQLQPQRVQRKASAAEAGGAAPRAGGAAHLQDEAQLLRGLQSGRPSGGAAAKRQRVAGPEGDAAATAEAGPLAQPPAAGGPAGEAGQPTGRGASAQASGVPAALLMVLHCCCAAEPRGPGGCSLTECVP